MQMSLHSIAFTCDVLLTLTLACLHASCIVAHLRTSAIVHRCESIRACCSGYLWGLPAHRQAWRGVAAEDGGRGLYLKFVHVVCSDVQYLLDEILRVLPEASPLTHRTLSMSLFYNVGSAAVHRPY